MFMIIVRPTTNPELLIDKEITAVIATICEKGYIIKTYINDLGIVKCIENMYSLLHS